MPLRKHLLTAALIAASIGAAQQTPPPAPPPAPAGVILETDFEYSNVGGRMAMDIARPANARGPLPAVLIIHGGGFRAGNRQSKIPLAYRFAQRGYVAATMSYRLSPQHQFPAAVEDAKAAVRFLRANAMRFSIDPDRIGVTGDSAGGHLALMTGLLGGSPVFEGTGPNRDVSSKVQCVVNYYGPTDFTKSYGKSVDAADVLPLFLGGDLAHEEALHRRSSPLNWVTPDAAPTLTIHGTEDKYVAYEHAGWITERLKAAGVDAELETLPGAGHGFKGADAERAEKRMMEYFDRYLAPRPSRRRIVVSDHGPAGELVAMEWPSGKVLWTIPNGRGHDVQVLPNGHILYTVGPQHAVVEVDEHRRAVWSYGPAEGLQHPLSAQRLSNGNTLIGDAQLGRVIEVSPDRKVVWNYESADIGGMRMRNSRRTDAGTTLIAVEAVAKIIEVDREGKIVWQWQAPDGEKRRAYQAKRLANGNTLISLYNPGEIVEVDPAGKVVRSIAGKNLEVQLGWASGMAPLPDGGLIVSDYTGRRLIEFDAQGRVVAQLRTGPRTVASVDLLP